MTSFGGLPDGVSDERLHAICRRILGEDLGFVEHERIWSFRDTKLDSPVVAEFRDVLAERGTFRIFLTSISGRRASVICKHDPRPSGMSEFQQWWFYGNARSELDAPTEALVYRFADDMLRGFVPTSYGQDQVAAGRSYQYWIEDLDGWPQARQPASVVRVAAALPSLHAAMAAWGNRIGIDQLSRADAQHDAHTRDVVRFTEQTGDDRVRVVRDLWLRLIALRELPGYRGLARSAPIHGDLWLDNVLVDPVSDGSFRVIDWESVVVGRPHFDLALLLIRESPETLEQAIRAYANAETSLSLEEHWRLFKWNRLEYCLIKAINTIRSWRLEEMPTLEFSHHAAQAIREATFFGELFE